MDLTVAMLIMIFPQIPHQNRMGSSRQSILTKKNYTSILMKNLQKNMRNK